MARVAKTSKDAPNTNDLLSSFLKEEKDNHYNFEPVVDWKVSTGSIILDCELGGGFPPGLVRFCGTNESGKTQESLEVCRNFLKMKDARGFYIKAEGRLSDEVQERSGVKFVFSPAEWVDGTCFVLETNVYETACRAMLLYIKNNPEKKKFCFILDSVDGLSKKDDLEKDLEESNKVAGGAVIASNFMKRVSIPLAKRGHMAIFISQVRADIKLDPYSKAPQNITTATGGNALLHYPNWILEYDRGNSKDKILLNPKEKFNTRTNPCIGHWAKVTVRKSTNETTGNTYLYPIKHGRTGGRSIWVEREIVDLLRAFGHVEGTSWIEFTDEFYEEHKLESIGMEKRHNGNTRFTDAVESNPEFVRVMREYLISSINGIPDSYIAKEEAEEGEEPLNKVESAESV